MLKNITQLFDVFKPSDNILKKDMRFFKLADRAGWTDGYIADITNHYLPTIEAKAKLKGIEYDTQKPKIQPILDAFMDAHHDVETIEFDLNSKTAVLVNSEMKAYVNPHFLAYFQKAYADRGGIDRLSLTGERSQVKVYVRDELVGLIMPIKVNK